MDGKLAHVVTPEDGLEHLHRDRLAGSSLPLLPEPAGAAIAVTVRHALGEVGADDGSDAAAAVDGIHREISQRLPVHPVLRVLPALEKGAGNPE
ncbi:MAG: hypothetical protein FJZ98_08190, partial [Chloroflexi bacterium]|nr:hypothetical protein [Chloroflexota bacterium]